MAKLSIFKTAKMLGLHLGDRKSITGGAFMHGTNPIHWVSKKQPTVSLSSASAEYIACAYNAAEILYLFLPPIRHIINSIVEECRRQALRYKTLNKQKSGLDDRRAKEIGA